MTTENLMPPIKLAFILNNEVADILHTDERLSAIFMSEPKVIDITNLLNQNPGFIGVGSKYDPITEEFEYPEPAIIPE